VHGGKVPQSQKKKKKRDARIACEEKQSNERGGERDGKG